MVKTELSDEQLMLIDKFAGVIDKTRLADKLGISRKTFYNILERDEDVRDRFNKAETEAIGEIASICYEKAIKGDMKAINLYLKCVAGWKETQAIDHSVQPYEPRTLDDFYGTDSEEDE